MIQMLELSENNFKAPIIKMLWQTIKNTLETNEKIENLSKEIENHSKEIEDIKN